MRELTYFKLWNCPYCRQADGWLEELRAQDPAYRDIPIRVVDEAVERALADRYDYYYVPCFFLGDRKLHEGAATLDKIKGVLDACL